MAYVELRGAVVAEPERIADGRGLKFPLYENERRKNKETGEYENTGNVLKLMVTVWGDQADTVSALGVKKGDLVDFKGKITEKEYDKKDGSKGRALESTFVDEVSVYWSAPERGVVSEGGQEPW